MRTLTLTELENRVGGLAQTSKMPCPSWSISARRCHIGSKLAAIKGSICEGCYALKGAYSWSNTQTALERRWEAYSADPEAWAMNMADIITRKKLDFFRWFDSGDVQSVEMLGKIVKVANLVPFCLFWLPTKELSIVSDWLKTHGKFPKNLTVRLSAFKRDAKAGKVAGCNLPSSTVTDKEEPIGFPCPSREQGNRCGDCRACWSSDVQVVSYYWH